MLFQLVFLISFVCLTALLLLVLFEPGLPYRVVDLGDGADVRNFPRLVASLTDSEVQKADTVEILANGDRFYAAELAAIQAARVSVHIEAFIIRPSVITDRFLAALIDCANRGVKVRIVIDAIGSLPTPDSYFKALRDAGASVAWYQPIRWYTLKRFNNRSHRDLIVVDGEVAFIGGAGIAAYWSDPQGGDLPWRDIMVRVTGSVVAGLQSVFLENWLEATGELLAGESNPSLQHASQHSVPAVVVTGTPSPARASRARVLFQLALATASKSIEIHSPYFLPDRSARRELIAAAARRVHIRIIVPGNYNDHTIVRLASRRQYGELLRGGVEIFEYLPGMIHAKTMVVDGRYAIVGSTNFDSRSFELNDEVNLALFDTDTADQLKSEFEQDLLKCRQIKLDDWQRRSLMERIFATVCIVLERQE
jgi:cardiolipin synthase A/B